jgi:hypothetical protein
MRQKKITNVVISKITYDMYYKKIIWSRYQTMISLETHVGITCTSQKNKWAKMEPADTDVESGA